MSAEECHRLKEEIESAIARQENFVDKCKILWDRMKTLMTGIAQLKTRKCLKDKETAETAESVRGTQPVLPGAVRTGSKDKKRKASQAKTLRHQDG